MFSFTELGNVIVTNPMFIVPWVHEKFTVKFTMSNVDGHSSYMHIASLTVLSMHMRQSPVEIESCSITYFDRTTAIEAL